MKTFLNIKVIFLIGLSALLVSCSSTSHFHQESVNTTGLFGIEATDTTNMANAPWEDIFSDVRLQKLIEEGLRNNPDLQIAMQRVLEAEAYFSQSKAALLPGINARGTANYTRNPESVYPDGPRETNSFQLGLESSWELDLWGKLRSSKRAAYANLLTSDAGQKAVQTQLIASIASAYYSLMALDAKMEITRETIKNSINLVETMKVLKESGFVTGAAVVQSEAARYAAEVTIPDLEQQIKETENFLSLLLGKTPGPISRTSLNDQQASALLQTGVPSQLLENRPDVLQAKYQVMNAFEMTNVAKANFYPSLTLTASAGFVSTDLNELLDPASFAANVLGGLTAPLFNKRANITRLKVAKAQQEESLINLRNSLLTAGQEVNNALGSFEASQKKMELRTRQVESLEKSVEYTKELLTYGSATYTEVLNAQQYLLSAQLNNVNDHLQQLQAVVTLYRALGGGWK